MKKSIFIVAVILTCLTSCSKDRELQQVLKRFPQSMVDEFYQNGLIKAEKFSAEKMGLTKTEKVTEFVINPIPEANNQYRNECGGMSSAFVMRFYGEDTNGDKVYAQIKGKNPDGSISPKPLKNYWDTNTDYQMEVFKGDIKSLKEIVSHNIPVIVLINCEGGWHYVPVVGFDKKYIYLQDSVPKFRNVTGQKYNRKETYKKFEKLWNVILPESDHLMFVAVKQ